MANLPDLNTSEVSFIGYWNAIDQGGLVEVNPSDVLSNGNIVSSTAYDNGVEGKYSTGKRDINFRVKTDGWFVVWYNREESLGTRETDLSNLYGPFDILSEWWNNSSQGSLGDTRDNTIQGLFNELENSNNGSLNSSDIGYYDFRNETATATSILGSMEIYSDYGRESTFYFQYSSSTIVDDLWFIASTGYNPEYADGGRAFFQKGQSDEVELANSYTSNNSEYSARDAKYREDTEPDTEYEMNTHTPVDRATVASVIMVWE